MLDSGDQEILIMNSLIVLVHNRSAVHHVFILKHLMSMLTVNKCVETKTYPLPTADDTFARLAGSHVFIKF